MRRVNQLPAFCSILFRVLFYLCCFAKGCEIIDQALSRHWEDVDFTQHFPNLLCFPNKLCAISQSILKSSTSSLSLINWQSIDVGRSLGKYWVATCDTYQLQSLQLSSNLRHYLSVAIIALQWIRIGRTLVKHWCWSIIGKRLSNNLRHNSVSCNGVGLALDRVMPQVSCSQSSPNDQPISIDCEWSNEREEMDDLRFDWEIAVSLLGKHRVLGNCWVKSTSSQWLLNA